MEHIIVFGAGIAGLSTAHYLMERGYKVTVIESLQTPGGLARSERVPGDKGMPSEYSWRGFGPWYHNSFDILKRIPIGKTVNDITKRIPRESVYDSELSHPINFIITPDDDTPSVDRFRLTIIDKIKLFWLILKAWSASEARSKEDYSLMNASEVLTSTLSPKGSQTLSCLFGPWVGSDASRVSVHQVSLFFRRNLYPGPPSPYYHNTNPPFIHAGKSGWLILKRPSNESWFDPWVEHLASNGVTFRFGSSLDKLHWDKNTRKITYAEISGEKIIGDRYVLAINPYTTRDILNKTPDMVQFDAQLALFSPLTNDKPHVQISFRIPFYEKINLSKSNSETAIILVDSEFDITLFSQDQLFHKNTFLGENIKSLWSGTATIDSVPGKLYNLPMNKLTRVQFINEIKYQIYRSSSLNTLVKKSNNNRALKSFPIGNIEVWHTWKFKNNELRDEYPKWVNNTRNQSYLPRTKTLIKNLYLAGAHTKTNTDLYSMEAAVESGRRAADCISNMNTVIPQHIPLILRSLQFIDSILYSYKLPNVINVLAFFLFILFIYLLFKYYFRKRTT